MPDPTSRQGHVDQLLTTFAVDWMQRATNYVATRVFPVVNVARASDKYLIYPRSYFFRDDVGPRPLGGYPRQVGYKVQTGQYLAEEEAIEAVLDDRERANATPPHDPERSKIKLLMSQHATHLERTWADGFFKAGVWTTERTGVAAAPTGTQRLHWSNDNADPIRDIDNDRILLGRTTGLAPNKLVLGADVKVALRNHPDLIGRLADNSVRMVSDQFLAGLFDLDEVLTGMGVVNTGAERDTAAATEAAANYGFVVGAKDALLVYAATEPSLDQPSGGYTIAWDGLIPGGGVSTPAVIERGRDERAHSDWFQARMAHDQKIVAPDLGVYYSGIVA